MDVVFRGLNDPSRRKLLDSLFTRDGQTLGELCKQLPDMTRYGVMNHLKVLEQAGLITTARDGREKFHYLNAVPIQMVHDRWINKYTEGRARALVALKHSLEGDLTMTKPDHVYEAYIRCTPEAAWAAMTEGDQTVQYFFQTRVESDFEPGSPIRYLSPAGTVVADGEILAADRPKQLDLSFHPRWDPELEAEGPVRTLWVIEPAGESTKVRVEYYDLDPGSATYRDFVTGVPLIVSGMKTLLETGQPLP